MAEYPLYGAFRTNDNPQLLNDNKQYPECKGKFGEMRYRVTPKNGNF